MKAILSMALVLGLCGFAGAEEKADPVGTWKCEYTIGDMKRTAELTVKKDGDKLVGTMSWPDQTDEKLKDKDTDSIVDDFKSDEFERFYKFFDMKAKFNRSCLAAFGITEEQLSKTNWFRTHIQEIMDK